MRVVAIVRRFHQRLGESQLLGSVLKVRTEYFGRGDVLCGFGEPRKYRVFSSVRRSRRVHRPARKTTGGLLRQSLKRALTLGATLVFIVVGCGSRSSVEKQNIYSSRNANMLQMGGMELPNESGKCVSMEVLIFKSRKSIDEAKSAAVMVIFTGANGDLKLAKCPAAELVADGRSLPIREYKYQKSEIMRESDLVDYRIADKRSEERVVVWLGMKEFRSFLGAGTAESRICDQSFRLQSWQSAEIKQLLASAAF